MSVRYRFTIEVYGFMHSLRTAQDAMRDGVEIEVEDSEDRRRRQNESRCMEEVNCSTKG